MIFRVKINTAIHIIYILRYNHKMNVKQLSELMDSGPSTIAAVMTTLVEHKVVIPQRGFDGGYSLNPQAMNVTVYGLLRMFYPELATKENAVYIGNRLLSMTMAQVIAGD